MSSASITAESGVSSAGLTTATLPQARCRGHSAGDHGHRHVPRHDVPGDADGFEDGEACLVVAERDGFPLQLVGHSGVVAEVVRRPLDGRIGLLVGFALIQGFHQRKALGLLADRLTNLPQKLTACAGRHVGPGSFQRGLGIR